jgi:exodeoxyribonuclease VII large subunit
VRATTPTQAAEMVVSQLEGQQRRVEVADQELRSLFIRKLERARLHLRGLEGARGLARLPLRIKELDQRLRRLEALPQLLRSLVAGRRHRVEGAVSHLYRWPVRFGAPRRRELVTATLTVARERLRGLMQRRKLELEARERALGALSPRRVLERGYSITTREGEAQPLRDAGQVLAGTRLTTTLARGKVRSLTVGRVGEQGSLFDAEGTAARGEGSEERRRR